MLSANFAPALTAAGAAARAGDYEGRVTFKVVMACIIAATGGMLFGYDLGVTGTYRPDNSMSVETHPS